MELEDLPQEVSVWLHDLKHGSGTLQADILDAFENAETFDEAVRNSIDSMAELMTEAAQNIEWLNHHRKCG